MATNNVRFVTKNGLDANGNSITNIGTTGASLTQSGAFAVTLSATGATNITLPTSGTLATTTGTVSSANTLTTPRAINGVNFDGSAPITVTAAASTLTGTTLASNVVSSSLTSVGTITSGTWSGSFGAVSGANLTSLNASNLSTGTVGTARLGSGTADNTKYLRGDSTWQTLVPGSDTQLIYNNSGAFGTSSSLSWNNTTATLTVGPQTGAPGGKITIGPPDGSGIGAGTSVLIKATSTDNNYSSSAGSITLAAGSLTGENGNGEKNGGSVFIEAGDSVVTTFGPGGGGNVSISSGLGTAGNAESYIVLKTAPPAGALVERLRILNNGAWSVGTGGTATGTSGQVLTSTGSGSAPTWQAPSTVAAAGTLTGTTLAANVVSSSLTSVGTITSGTWSGSFGAVSGANLTSLNASNLSTGTVGTARLGSGTADNTTFLRGDGTWAVPAGGGGTPGGATTQVQFNNAGAFAGDPNFTFNSGTDTLTVTNIAGAGAAITALNASNISTGTVATARLGTGTADNTTYLRGDGTWATVAGGSAALTSTFVGYGSGSNVLTGSSALTFNATTNVLTVGTNITAPTIIQAPDLAAGGTAASSLTLRAGDGQSANVSPGALSIRAGNYTSSNTSASSAPVSITGGSITAAIANNNAGGAVTIAGGTSATAGAGAGGSITISGGAAGNTGAGGNVTINSGTTPAGSAGGFLSFGTAATTAVVERLRILNNGAWSVGTGGAATGTSGQVLTSTGATTPPTWQSVTSATISGGATNQIPYQSAASTTAFSAAFTWANGTNTFAIGTNNATPAVIQAVDLAVGSTAASSLTVRGGDGGSSTVNAGALILRGGNYTSTSNAQGANVTLTGGSHTGSGTTAGASGGSVTIAGGSGGASGAGVGGNVAVNGGAASGSGVGGNVTISGGTTSTGTTGGYISFATTAAAGAVAERFRIRPDGGWALGSGGTAIGTANAPLLSSGAANPAWATNMTWDSTNRIFAVGLNATNGGTFIQTPDVAGTIATAALTVKAGDATASTGGGGALNLLGGTSVGGPGGNATIRSGSGTSHGSISVLAAPITPTAAAGGAVTITAGSTDAGTANGGTVTISAGACGAAATAGTGGNLTMVAGGHNNNGTGGAVSITAGSVSSAGNGGAMTLSAGSGGASTSGNGGALNINGGSAQNGNGGSITISPGNASGTGGNLVLRAGIGTSTGGPTGGVITFSTGNGTSYIERFRIDNNGAWSLAGVAGSINGQVLRSNAAGVPSWQLPGTAPSNVSLATGTYLGTNGTTVEFDLINTAATTDQKSWFIRNSNTGQFQLVAFDDAFSGSTTPLAITRSGTTATTIAFTGTAMTTSGTFQATTVNVTGSTAPANGMYLPAANTLGFSTNSTSRLTITSTGSVDFGARYTELNTSPSVVSGGTTTIDCNAGNVFTLSMTGSTTVAFSNVPASGRVYSVTLIITQTSLGAITWPAAVKWPSATAPTLSAVGKTDIITLVTSNAGSAWYGFVSGQNYS